MSVVFSGYTRESGAANVAYTSGKPSRRESSILGFGQGTPLSDEHALLVHEDA